MGHSTSAMTSSRPYLVRALYEWIVDNGMTPHLLVNAGYPGADVPERFVEEGRIVLNVAPQAVRALDLGNEAVRFNARFGGTPTDVYVPTGAVLAIYARENGQGMAFPEEEPPPEPPKPPEDEPQGKPRRPHLKLVD